MKILLFIEHLGLGGAVRQVSYLAGHLAMRGHDVSVLALYTVDPDWNLLWKAQCDIRSLIERKALRVLPVGVQLMKATLALRRLLKKEKVEILYSFQGQGAWLIAWLASRGIAGTQLAWGSRGTGRRNTLNRRDWKVSLPFHLCRWISRSIPLMIANSEAGHTRFKTGGYRCIKQSVISNGFDTDKFRPDAEARMRVRSEWKIKNERLIGIVGRLVLSKGHRTFLEAAKSLCKNRKDVRFVIVGDGSDKEQLDALSRSLGLTESLIWAGPRQDMPAVYNALDILCSSSRYEGFPNVIGEAMACGIPCVVTDVGDSASIVASEGIVVPPDDSQMLANGLETMLSKLDDINPIEVRGRIVTHFGLRTMVDATEQALNEIRLAH